MKVKSAIKKICLYCTIIRRGKNLFVRLVIFYNQ
ncbi:MAG: 50S ribosomal protein L36 [Caldiserica bacterium]|nr:50S ribosomal protein L36 [Caldisericota bacterium]